jgi:hypothetical protein
MTSICDERGQELNYAGMPISDVSDLSSKIYIFGNVVTWISDMELGG